MSKIGFIGMGNMAQALAEGWVNMGAVDDGLYAYAPTRDKLLANAERLGFAPTATVEELVDICDIIIIACKPYQIDDVLSKTAEKLKGKALVSIAAGWVFDNFWDKLDDVRIQCIMPNTPAMVGEGVFLFENKGTLTNEEDAYVRALFEKLGVVIDMPTALMGIGGAVSGCGPAFVDIFMEAYADAAVKYGIPRVTAYQLIAQTVLGSAKLQMETGKHPGVLKDEVCSPNGTTICGVAALEENGFRNACIKSIDSIMLKKSGK